jgi:hypothetical protein
LNSEEGSGAEAPFPTCEDLEVNSVTWIWVRGESVEAEASFPDAFVGLHFFSRIRLEQAEQNARHEGVTALSALLLSVGRIVTGTKALRSS